MSITAKLEIILKAGETIVATSNDPKLWQYVLSAINSPIEAIPSFAEIDIQNANRPNDLVTKLAEQLDVSVEVVKGACSPTSEAPFICLDKHHWEALVKNHPGRGKNSIAPSAIAATVLVLWADIAKLDKPTPRSVGMVLRTIDKVDSHISRGLENCEWLQLRNGFISINPAKVSAAIAVVRAYCLERPINSD
jgi:hypothetical protein